MKKSQELPWVEKYRPKNTKEMVGFSTNIKKIKDFIKNFEEQQNAGRKIRGSQKAILLEGPPGIGKTTVVYAVANDLGYSVVEMNASDIRTENAIVETLEESISSTDLLSYLMPEKLNRKKIILIDEVDGISGKSDRGGVKAIVSLIKKTKNPIILTCNFYDSKFKSLYDISTKIPCRSLQKATISNLLKEIAEKENLKVDDEIVEAIAMNSGGDMRSAINDLQALSQGVFTDMEFLDMHRDIQEKIFSFLQSMFEQKTIRKARDILSNIDFDYKIIHKIIHANMKAVILDRKDRKEIFNTLLDADNLMNQIMTRMDFSLLSYFFDLVSGGVIVSVTQTISKGYKKFKMPNLGNLRFRFTGETLLEELQNFFYKSKLDIVNQIIPQINEILSIYDEPTRNKRLVQIATELDINSAELKKFVN
ncbi:MAG: replication factor C large subunit [Candidatus Lokiarchaeota archaeon]|nr:replication factor C large subunit [Candidatus Lokiarchaeota archaeon]